MSIYDFVVAFVGTVPEQYEFIYTILTVAISCFMFGTFTSLFYFVLKLVRGVM